jgi:hypothetical protein
LISIRIVVITAHGQGKSKFQTCANCRGRLEYPGRVSGCRAGSHFGFQKQNRNRRVDERRTPHRLAALSGLREVVLSTATEYSSHPPRKLLRPVFKAAVEGRLPAASASSVCAICRPNGADSLRHSVSIRNSVSARFKVVLSRRRRDDFSENRLIPTAYAVYDFLPSYAIPAVLLSRCDQGVTQSRRPEGLDQLELRYGVNAGKQAGAMGPLPREFSWTPPARGDGGTAPVEIFKVRGFLHAPSSGVFRSRVRLSPLTGRTSEFGILQEELENTIRGEGHIVGLVGEAGIGKSRLCFKFAERGGSVQHSQSPCADTGAVMEPACASEFRSYWSILLTFQN